MEKYMSASQYYLTLGFFMGILFMGILEALIQLSKPKR
jgi:hypothetical protein